MIPRAYKGAGLILLCLSLYVFGRCSGKSEGKDSVRDKELKAQISSHQKAAKAWKDSATSEKHRADSLEKKKDSVRTRYVTLKDTLTLTDTVEVKVALATADTVIVTQDSVITHLKTESLALRNVVGFREQEIRALNERMSIASRRIGRARREGFIVGFGVAAFAVITYKGMH